MKRSMILVAVVSVAIASLVWAQTASQATLRLPSGDRAVSAARHGDQTFLAVDEVIAALGGSSVKERNGLRLKLGSGEAALSAETRFATVRDDLIEMPELPLVLDQRLYVPWQFFDGFLRKVAGQSASWDAASNALTIKAAEVQPVNVQVSVVDLADLSKVVLQFSGPVEYRITREPTRYLVQFSAPVKAPLAEQSFESALVSKVAFIGNTAEITVTSDSVLGDPYQLENPFRLVLDLKKGVAPITPSTLPNVTHRNQDQPGIHTIVIDAGHGGKDVGATGPTGLLEKETTLALCRKLGALLEKDLGARVILTRSDDTLVPLDQRTAIANQYKADLFLSIHLNAAVVRGARGSETYFLSLEASDELARKAAEHENQTSSPSTTPASADLDLILWDLAQQDYLKESSRLAELLQDEMNHLNNTQNRGVKQAPFKVLVGATMPAALVEVGFISNPEEESKLRDDAYQTNIVSALEHAVRRYKDEYEVRIGLVPPPPAASVKTIAPPAAPAAANTTPRTPATTTAQTPQTKNPGRR